MTGWHAKDRTIRNYPGATPIGPCTILKSQGSLGSTTAAHFAQIGVALEKITSSITSEEFQRAADNNECPVCSRAS